MTIIYHLEDDAAFRVAEHDNGRATISYRPADDHHGYPMFEDVCTVGSVKEAMAWIDHPAEWWGRG